MIDVGRRRPLLVVGPALAGTGFGRVTAGLLPALSRRRVVCQLAPDCPSDIVGLSWPVYGNPTPLDPFATTRLTELVRSMEPVVLALHGLTVIPRYLAALGQPRAIPFVAYCPIEGSLSSPTFVDWAAQVDHFVVYNAFARSAVLRALDRPTTCRQPEIAVIPHGVDTDCFTPIDRRLARADACRLIGKSIEPDAFIVLNVSKNEPRKRLDLTIEAFARFARDAPPNVYLWLHTEPRAPGHNIFAAARAAGIGTRLLVTTTTGGQPALSDAQLNRIYNACDVGLNTAMGEAWGLASFEHAATGAPQVLPAIGAATELWHDAALLIPAHQPARVGSVFIGGAVAPDAVAQALDRLYSDSDYRAAMGRAALRNAHNPRYRWSAIADQWDALIADVDSAAP